MREVKFRGLMTTGQWVYGLPQLDLPNSTVYFNECSYRICWNHETGGQSNAPVKNGTLCQFTGLKDKNGKEIYEGDIVKTIFYNHSTPNSILIQEVIFTDGGFALKSLKQVEEIDIEDNRNFVPLYYSHAPNKIEVIGNIYENSELINQQLN